MEETVILSYYIKNLSIYIKSNHRMLETASMAFQGGVSLFSAWHWKAYNTFTPFYLKDASWADFELFHLGPVVHFMFCVYKSL